MTATKAARLRRLAARWLSEHGVHADEVRIDLVGVLPRRAGGPAGSSTCAGWADGLRDRADDLAVRRRPATSSTSRPTSRRAWSAPRWSAGPTPSISEARDRCRAAIANSGFEWPATRRVTILLSPADLPKRGPHFDLAIAVAVLAADGEVPGSQSLADGLVLVGELTLDGRLRAVPGRAADGDGGPRPRAHLRDGPRAAGRRRRRWCPAMEVIGVRSLAQVVALLRGERDPRRARRSSRWPTGGC